MAGLGNPFEILTPSTHFAFINSINVLSKSLNRNKHMNRGAFQHTVLLPSSEMQTE